MPLSDEELRLLEQMERALAAEDPRFVSALEGRTLVRAARARIAVAALVFVGGGAAIGVAMWQRMIWLGVLGFVLMIASASLGLAHLRSHRLMSTPGLSDGVPEEGFSGLRVIPGGRGGGSWAARRYHAFLDRLEARWLHRRDQNL